MNSSEISDCGVTPGLGGAIEGASAFAFSSRFSDRGALAFFGAGGRGRGFEMGGIISEEGGKSSTRSGVS